MTENVMWLPPPPPPPEDEQQVQDAQESGAEALDADAWENLPAATRLTDVLQWLRSEYFYCVFCGCQARFAHLGSTKECVQLPREVAGHAELTVMCGGRSSLIPSSSSPSAQE